MFSRAGGLPSLADYLGAPFGPGGLAVLPPGCPGAPGPLVVPAAPGPFGAPGGATPPGPLADGAFVSVAVSDDGLQPSREIDRTAPMTRSSPVPANRRIPQAFAVLILLPPSTDWSQPSHSRPGDTPGKGNQPESGSRQGDQITRCPSGVHLPSLGCSGLMTRRSYSRRDRFDAQKPTAVTAT